MPPALSMVATSAFLALAFGLWPGAGAAASYDRSLAPAHSSADFHFQLTPGLSIEVGRDSPLVDPAIAAQPFPGAQTVNVAADYRLLDSVTLIGRGSRQWFGIGKQRLESVGWLVYSPTWFGPFNAQLRYRRIESEFAGVAHAGPSRLEEAMGSLQYSRALFDGNFLLTTVVGGGARRVKGAGPSALYQAELRGQGWLIGAVALGANAGFKSSGGQDLQAAAGSHHYCYGYLYLMKSF